MIDFDFGKLAPGSWSYNDLRGILETGAAYCDADVSTSVMPVYPKVIVDVGANVGAFTRWARARFPQALIIALEPNPDTFQILARNVRGRPGIIALPIAASEDRTTRQLRAGIATVGESSFEDIGQQDSARTCAVPCARLDQLLSSPPDILKIDTEGHELSVLQGCTGWVGGLRGVSYLAVEWHRRADEAEAGPVLTSYGLAQIGRELEAGCEDRIVARYSRVSQER